MTAVRRFMWSWKSKWRRFAYGVALIHHILQGAAQHQISFFNNNNYSVSTVLDPNTMKRDIQAEKNTNL